MLAVTKLYLLDRRYDEFVLRYTTLWVELTSKKSVVVHSIAEAAEQK